MNQALEQSLDFLQVSDVHKIFGPSVVVDKFNLTVKKGEFVSFLGPSGCGKTTTLRMVAGFETPTSGRITINGADITNIPPNKRNIGMVFQSYALFPNMSVRDNIAFGLKVAHQPADLIKRRVDEMLGIIHMGDFGARYSYQLSGGQQQRVALARALAIQPQVLLLDEPLSALDAKIRLSLRQEIRAIQRELAITTIYVTHDQEEALSISDRIVVMNKGRMEQVGTPLEIYNTPHTAFVASFVGTLNVLNVMVDDNGTGRVSTNGQSFNVGKEIADPNGQPAAVAIRPEAFTIANGNIHPSANTLDATVEDMYFLGSVVRLRVRLGEQAINADVFNNLHLELPERGAAVKLNFMPEACWVMKHDAHSLAVERDG